HGKVNSRELQTQLLATCLGGVDPDAAHRGQVPALLNGGGQQMHNRPDRDGTATVGAALRALRQVGLTSGVIHRDPTLVV
ncbi:hypothetical protein, partial [Kutzneria viridogrisea]|uniref:hypothetical protein n=1 Tax=Kutzneria viridogrisea TaxID=47990 RepID=UPI0031F7AEAC